MNKPQLIIDLSGPDGNAFVLMATARNAMKQSGCDEAEIKWFMDQWTTRTYEENLKIMAELFDIVDTANLYPHIIDEAEVVTTVVKKFKP